MEQYFRTRASVDDDPDLARNRRANDARLKSRFEHIFEKYGKNFEGVGDEIDLETGHIVVNNGHIARMQHEVDPGQGASSQVLRVLEGSLQDEGAVHGEGFVIEDSTEEVDDSEELGATATSGDSSSDAEDGVEVEEQRKPNSGPSDELSSDFYQSLDVTPEKTRRSAQKMPERKSAGKHRTNSDQAISQTRATLRRESLEEQPMDLPFLQQSVKSMQALPGQSGSIDLDAIQALGQSIAKQLARYMNGGSKASRRASPGRTVARDPRWDYPTLPGDGNDRTPSPPRPASTSAALFTASPDRGASIWAPQRQRRKRKSKLQSQLVHESAVVNGDDDVDPLQSDPPHGDPPSQADTRDSGEPEETIPLDCYNCGTTSSRAWRTGPDGRLCDSCGTFFRKYGLLKAVEDQFSTSAPRSRPRSSAAETRHSAHGKADVFAIPSTDAPAPETMAGYAANTARRITADGQKGRFTLEEEECIIRLHEIDAIAWDHIGFLISHQTAYAVHSHYQKFLKRADCEARRRLLHKSVPVRTFGISAVAMTKSPGFSDQDDGRIDDIEAFTTSENETMSFLREQEGMTWAEIAGYLPNRTSHELQAHYNEHLTKGSLASPATIPIDPALAEHNTAPAQTSSAEQAVQRVTDSSTSSQKANRPDKAARTGAASRHHPYGSDEDALLLKMRDEMGMPFAQMTQYLTDRAEESIFDRYNDLKADQQLDDTVEHTLTNDTSLPSGCKGDDAPAAGRRRRTTVRSALKPDAQTQMLPPPIPSGNPSRQDSASSTALASLDRGAPEKNHIARAESQPRPLPQTPSLQAVPVSAPPTNPQVGPSAWASTQPTSKGPLPFQPARKGLAPLRAKSNSRGLHDPFLSHKKPEALLTPPSSNSTASSNMPSSESTKPSSNSHTTGRKTRNRATPDTVVDTVHVRHPTPPFTPMQDRFIMRAREKRSLTWEAIAKALPSDFPHTASAIMHRYYDFLLSRNPRDKPQGSYEGHMGETGETGGTGDSHFSEEESRQLAQYTTIGMSWAEIADRIPGHTPVSMQKHYVDYLARGGHDRPSLEHNHRLNPLLHQALRNLARRKSNIVGVDSRPKDGVQECLPSSASSPTQSSALGNEMEQSCATFDGDWRASPGSASINENAQAVPDQEDEYAVSVDDDEGDAEQPSAIEQDERASSQTKRGRKSAGARKNTTPALSQRRRGLVAPESDTTQQAPHVESPESATKGPGSYEGLPQPHPEVVINVRKRGRPRASSSRARPGGDSLIDKMKEFVGERSLDTNNAAFSESEHESTVLGTCAPKVVTPTGTKRKRRSKRPKRLSEAMVADSDSDAGSGQVQAREPDDASHDPPPAITAPTKRRPGRPRKYPLVQPNAAPQSKSFPEGSNRPQRKTRKTHESLNVFELVGRFADQEGKDLARATDTDSEPGGTSDQDLDHNELRDAVQQLDVARPEAAEIAQVSRESSNEPDESERPEIDWKELVYEIMRSNHGKATRCRDVQAWVREHHTYYRHTKNPWVHHIQNMMKRDPKLKKVDYGKHKSGYVFREPTTQPAMVESANDENERNGDDKPSEEPPSPTSPPAEPADTSVDNQSMNEEPAGDLHIPESPSHQLVDTSVDDEPANDEHAEESPAPASTPPQLTEPSTSATEINGISSDPLVKQIPGHENKFANFYTRRSLKHTNDAQDSSPRVKHARYSDTALIGRESVMITPARDGQGSLGSLARSAMAKRFEPLVNAGVRVGPPTSAVPSGRRFVVATDVSRDDGDEHDELS